MTLAGDTTTAVAIDPKIDEPAPVDLESLQSSNRDYLIGPLFDWLFVANLYWPLLVLVMSVAGEDFHTGVLFWQVYFITAPHRWITLFLVGFDREKTINRTGRFLAVGIAIVFGCLGLRVGTGSLICLGAIDYLWNAWHFASQHHGIYRIYERRSSVRSSKRIDILEKALFRGFLLYVIARVAGVGLRVGEPSWQWSLAQVDGLVALVPISLLVAAFVRPSGMDRGRMGVAYMASVMALFLAMLYAAHIEDRQLVLRLAVASALFHSIEYLAVVTWASTSESQRQRTDVVGAMARNWLGFLVFFMLFLGVTNYFIAAGYQSVWILINLTVAFLHYAYDGMIWKSKRTRQESLPSV